MMNKVILVGRLTGDPDARSTQGGTTVTRYTLAVDRKYKREGEPTADFIPCVAFGQAAEFASKYFTKGLRIAVDGRIQTGSYTDRDGRNVYTTDVIIDGQEFAQSKGEAAQQSRPAQTSPAPQPDDDGFMDIPDGVQEELPFS